MILVFCWEWNIFWMLQLSAFFLSLIRMFLFSRDQSEFFLCNLSEFSFVMFIETIFFLSVTEIVIQLELKSFFALNSVLIAKHVNQLLYMWIAHFLIFYKLLHDFAHIEWVSLQFRQQLSFSSFLTKHWSFSWFVLTQNLHLQMNLHILTVWLYHWHW